jgi:hypothetical protein
VAAFSERQRAELRDAAARSRLEALAESRRLAAQGLGGGATGAQPVDAASSNGRATSFSADAPHKPASVDEVLALPEAQEIIRRIGTAVDPDYPHRADHVKWVAAVAVKAKMQPTNAYAKATLP